MDDNFLFEPNIINLTPNSVVSPCGVAAQNTFNELLEIIPNYRTTHDLSIEKSPDGSFNSRLTHENLQTFLRDMSPSFFHHLNSLRLHSPKKKIIRLKTDAK